MNKTARTSVVSARASAVTALTALLSLSASALAQVTPASAPPADSALGAIKPMPAVAVPSAKEIVSKYVAALGGEDALRKITSRVDSGSIEMTGVKADFKLIAAAPDRRIVVVSSPTLGGDQIQGYDGAVAWDLTPTSKRVLSGSELSYRALTCDFYRPLSLGSKFDLRVLGVEERDGKPCYKLTATPISEPVKGGVEPGQNSEKPREATLFFDIESGLLVGQIVLRPTASGDLGVDTSYAEFKKFGDILVPTKTTSKVANSVQSVTVTSVEFNKVAADAFEIPAAIKELMPKPAGAPAPVPTPVPTKK